MTTPEPIPGATLDERLTNLAGALAERGVAELTIVSGGERRTLRARETDLPGELRAALALAPAVELQAGKLRARLTRDEAELYPASR